MNFPFRTLLGLCTAALLVACGGGGGGGEGSAGTIPPPTGGASTPTTGQSHLVSIKLVSAQADALAPGTSMKYVAWGTFSDRGERIISSTVTWKSSDADIATVAFDGGQYGSVQALRVGVVQISATQDGVTVTADVNVMPIKLLEGGPGDITSPDDAVSIDAQGRVQASVAHYFSGSMFGTAPALNLWGYDSASGWTAAAPANVAGNNRPTNPVLAANPHGQVVRAWGGDLGIFAALYDPASGWRSARNVSLGATGSSLRTSIDDSGNAMLVWVDSTNGVSYVRYDLATDSWSTPQQVPGGDGGNSAGGVAFAATGAGDAVMVRERWLTTWVVSAARYSPGTGWEPPQVLRSGSVYTQPDVALGSAGDIVVAGADQFNNVVYAARYVPGSGWTPAETLATTSSALGAKAAVNGAGQGVVVWGSNFDGSVTARRLVGGNWEPGFTPMAISVVGGTPEVLKPFIADDGRMFVSWNAGSARVGVRRFNPSTGWGAEAALRMGFKGFVYDVAFAFNSSGTGAAIWAEGYDRYDTNGFSHRYYDFYVDNTISY